MGEIAEMMLEGVLCEGCGAYIEEGEPGGFPRRCEVCGPARPVRVPQHRAEGYVPGKKKRRGKKRRRGR